MKRRPVKVKLIGKNNKKYQIQFPSLQIPVEVNKELFQKMVQSELYDFGQKKISA